MKKIIFKTFLFCTLSVGIFSCSKDEEATVAPIDYVIDAESLMRNMNIPGSVLKQGNIPVPTTQLDNITSIPGTVVVTSNSLFTLPFVTNSTDNRVARIAFIKLVGSSQYYQVEFDQNGNLVNGGTNNSNSQFRLSCSGAPRVQLPAVAGANNPAPYFNDAQVYLYSPPLQTTQILDPTLFSNPRYWTAPRTIKFKALDVGTGDVQISLTWDTRSDIDLWLIEPNGNKIYYGSKISSTGGELDFDNVVEYGPENIFYKNIAPSGAYKVQVNYYSGSPVTNYNIVVKKGTTINTYSGVLTNSGQTKDIVTFNK